MNGLQAIGVLIIRIWAFTMLYPHLSFFIQFFLGRDSFAQGNDLIFELFDSAIWLAIVLCAWFLAPKLAQRVIPDNSAGKLSLAVGERELVAIGSFLIAGFFIASRLPSFVSVTLEAVVQLAARPDNSPPVFERYAWSRVISEAATLVAMILIAGRPQAVARFFLSLRPAASPRAE